MKKQPRVSIIIPCFNAEKYLSDTLKSCLHQTYSNTEVIVVDDGSTDSSLEVARGFCSSHSALRVIHTDNHGQCSARNTGLEAAQGEYVKFLDSDDLLLPYSIKNEVELVTSQQADLSIIGEIGFHDLDSDGTRKQFQQDETILLSDAACYPTFLECIEAVSSSYNSILIHKEKVSRVQGFDTSLRAAEEINLHLKLATQFPDLKAVSHPKTLLLKRLHSDSLAVKEAKQLDFPNGLLSMQHAASFYLETGSEDLALKKFIFDHLYVSMTYAYRNAQTRFVESAFPIWQLSELPSAKLTPAFHSVLHKWLGFWRAERSLEKARKLKYSRISATSTHRL